MWSAASSSPRPDRASALVSSTSSILKTQPVRLISLLHLSRYVRASENLPLAAMHFPSATAVSTSPT